MLRKLKPRATHSIVFAGTKYLYQLISHLSLIFEQNHNSVAKTFSRKHRESKRENTNVEGALESRGMGVGEFLSLTTQTVNQSGFYFV